LHQKLKFLDDVIGMAVNQEQLQEVTSIVFQHLEQDQDAALNLYTEYINYYFTQPRRQALMWRHRWNFNRRQYIVCIDLGYRVCYGPNLCLAMLMEQLGLVYKYRISGSSNENLGEYLSRLNHLSLYLPYRKFEYVGRYRYFRLFGIGN